MSIGANITFYRKQLGMTQEQLSERIGVTSQAVSKWENETTNPDVTLLPGIAKVLSVDMNALFAEKREPTAGIPFEELCGAGYDALLSVFLSARRAFYGISEPASEEEKQKRLQQYKDELRAAERRSISVCEGDEYSGAVMVSDAFSCVDRAYGTKDSVCLFDVRRSGEILSVLGDTDVRKVLKVFYHALITAGESGTEKTAEEVSAACGLTGERVDEAAGKLVHIRLLDLHETIRNGEYRKYYDVLYRYDFIYVLAILRLTYLLAEDPVYDTQMFRGADGTRNYDGPGNV